LRTNAKQENYEATKQQWPSPAKGGPADWASGLALAESLRYPPSVERVAAPRHDEAPLAAPILRHAYISSTATDRRRQAEGGTGRRAKVHITGRKKIPEVTDKRVYRIYRKNSRSKIKQKIPNFSRKLYKLSLKHLILRTST
jgi:hypothetical protein